MLQLKTYIHWFSTIIREYETCYTRCSFRRLLQFIPASLGVWGYRNRFVQSHLMNVIPRYSKPTSEIRNPPLKLEFELFYQKSHATTRVVCSAQKDKSPSPRRSLLTPTKIPMRSELLPPSVSAPKNYKHCSSFFRFEQVVGQLVVARRVLM